MQILQSTKANTFLDSIGRNSAASRHAYKMGLKHFDKFLSSSDEDNANLNLETIIPTLIDGKLNVYEMLDQFVAYLMKRNLSNPSISLYMVVVRSYLSYYDIDIVQSKFKRRVKMPKHYREDEQPIDASDIRKLLLKCSNKKLKAYLLVLASSGLRAMEACALRLKDVDFSRNPTTIHVRKEFNKTKTARTVYLSTEATDYLQDLINYNYRNRKPQSYDLIFTGYFLEKTTPTSIYVRLAIEFQKLLAVAGMDERKEEGYRNVGG